MGRGISMVKRRSTGRKGAPGGDRSYLVVKMIRNRSEPGRDVVVVFDLDGTLTERDTSLPFVAHAIGARRLAVIVAARSPLFLVDLLGATRQEAVGPGLLGGVWHRWESDVHRRILDGAFRGAPREKLVRRGNQFAHEELDDFVTPEAVAQLRWHQAQGHLCVLASASLGVYVEPWAERMGFDHAVATSLAFDREGHFSGRFDPEPCWGTEKLRRVQHVVGSLEDSTLVVYGNARGDAALLAAADVPVLIRGASAWTEVAAEVRGAL